MQTEPTLTFHLPSEVVEIKNQLLSDKKVTLFIKREDLIHPWLSGNKYRKLKFNIINSISHGYDTIITFGGPFSNHLHATAGAGRLYNLKTIGILRGELDTENPTIRFCTEMGMELRPVARQAYRLKDASPEIEKIVHQYSNAVIIPEGGSNQLAMQGVIGMMEELEKQISPQPDVIVLPCGTGGTTAGILSYPLLKSKVLTFSTLKSTHLKDEIVRLASGKNESRLSVQTAYHFGGYGVWDQTLLRFIEMFEAEHQIPIDHVYNGKALFGLFDMVKNDAFRYGTRICYIHTGGLQGKMGLEYMMKKKAERRK